MVVMSLLSSATCNLVYLDHCIAISKEFKVCMFFFIITPLSIIMSALIAFLLCDHFKRAIEMHTQLKVVIFL